MFHINYFTPYIRFMIVMFMIYIYIYIDNSLVPMGLKRRGDLNLTCLTSCQGRFCNKSQDCRMSPNLPLGSLNSSIIEKSSPKFAMRNT